MQRPASIADQKRECREFAARNGWTIVQEEEDEAVRAGALSSRTGFARIKEAARARQIDVVLVEEVSRFSRDFLDGIAQLREFDSLGVKLADTKVGLLLLDEFAGQLGVSLALMQGQAETKRLGERSKRGLRGKTLQRFSAGGAPPFGYRREPVFSVNEKETWPLAAVPMVSHD
jgi:DNA invertase Pin-like site-specific DNA recombinase